jgi:hypothetical protein
MSKTNMSELIADEDKNISWSNEVNKSQRTSIVDFDFDEVNDLHEKLDDYDFTLCLKYLYSYGKKVHNPALVSCMGNLLRQVYMESKHTPVDKSVLEFNEEELTEINTVISDEKFERVMKYLYTRGYQLHNPALIVGMRKALKQVFMEPSYIPEPKKYIPGVKKRGSYKKSFEKKPKFSYSN